MDTYQFLFVFQFLFFTLFSLIIQIPAVQKKISSKNNFKIVIFVIAALQIIFMGLLKKEVGDIAGFSLIGRYFRQKLDYYPNDLNHLRYPFFPFLIPLYAVADLLNEKMPLFTFSFYLKLFLLIPLYFLAYQIYALNKKGAHPRGAILSLCFLASPLTYSIILFHGQIDVLVLGLFFLSVQFLIRKRNALSAVIYGFCVAAKTWSIIFLPSIFFFQKKISRLFLFGTTAATVLLAQVAAYEKWVYLPNLSSLVEAVGKPGGPTGIWGITYILSLWPSIILWVTKNNFLFFVSLFLILQIAIIKKGPDFWQHCFLTILGVYIIIPNWGVQYLFWVLPFLYLLKDHLRPKETHLFFLLTIPYVFTTYINVAFSSEAIKAYLINGLGFILWVFMVYWFLKLWKRPMEIKDVF